MDTPRITRLIEPRKLYQDIGNAASQSWNHPTYRSLRSTVRQSWKLSNVRSRSLCSLTAPDSGLATLLLLHEDIGAH